MQKFKLDDMVKGWIVGDFSPCVLRSADAEVAIKHYKKGECEARHYHKVASEITAVVSGRVQMNGEVLNAGDIVLIAANESADFCALQDSVTVVVKIPSVKGDKYDGHSERE